MIKEFPETVFMKNSTKKAGLTVQGDKQQNKPTWQGLIAAILLCICLALLLFFIIGFRGTPG